MNESIEKCLGRVRDFASCGTRRRTVLKGLAAGGIGLSGIAGIGAANSSAGERALYVWGYAPVLATAGAPRERFLERADRFGIDTVYLSWGPCGRHLRRRSATFSGRPTRPASRSTR